MLYCAVLSDMSTALYGTHDDYPVLCFLPMLLQKYPYMKSFCNPIPAVINGRNCNPPGSAVDNQTSGFCSGFSFGTQAESFWYYTQQVSVSPMYCTASYGNVLSCTVLCCTVRSCTALSFWYYMQQVSVSLGPFLPLVAASSWPKQPKSTALNCNVLYCTVQWGHQGVLNCTALHGHRGEQCSSVPGGRGQDTMI